MVTAVIFVSIVYMTDQGKRIHLFDNCVPNLIPIENPGPVSIDDTCKKCLRRRGTTAKGRRNSH